MKRREFVFRLGSAVAVLATYAVSSAQAQGKRLPRVGVLLPYNNGDPEGQARLDALLNGLTALSWKQDKNVYVDVLWPSDQPEQMRAAANALVGSAPDLIIVNSNLSLSILRATTANLPIVFVGVSDPVGGGFVKSLAQPGGNITGFTNFEPDIGGKWVQTLKELVPGLQNVLLLAHPTIPANAAIAASAESAGSALGVTVATAKVGSADDIKRAVGDFGAGRDKAVIVAPNPINIVQHELIIKLVADQRVPAIYPYRLFAASGGLMSYGIDQVDSFRRAAVYVDRILKGAKPGELPVQAPVKYELAINLKTAKALGIDVSPVLLARADEVIE